MANESSPNPSTTTLIPPELLAKHRFVNVSAVHESLDGLIAADHGSDTGINDPRLRQRVKALLMDLAGHEATAHEKYSLAFSRFLAAHLTAFLLSDTALAQGFRYEDLQEFVEWLEELLE